jgi:peptide/nickel transport system substrate-binding protein
MTHKFNSVFMLVLLLAVSACAPQRSPTSSDGGPQSTSAERKRIVGGMFSAPTGFQQQLTNPNGISGSVPGLQELWQMVDAGASYADEDNVVRPWLVEAIPSTENGLWKVLPDGHMETTWRLKPGITWHDGTPFTPDDLRFTLDVARDRDIGIIIPSALDLIEGIETVDERTAIVRWKTPFIDADTLFSSDFAMPLPKHPLEQPFNDDKTAFLGNPYWREGYVGLGPFKVRDWNPSTSVTLVANDNYVLGRPKLDEIEVRFLTERSALMAGLLAGTIEKQIGRGLYLEQVLQIQATDKDILVQTGGLLGGVLPVYSQFVNPDPPIVASLQFRRALLMAINRQEMTEVLNSSLGPVAHTWLQPDRPEFKAIEPKIVRYEYDPRAAAQMIEGLGDTMGADGVFRTAQGDKLTVQIQTNEQNALHVPSTLSVVGDWQRLGLDMQTDILPEQRVTDREYRAIYPAFSLVSAGISVKPSFHSSGIPLPENRFTGSNRSRYASPELDALIDRYLITIPMAERLSVLGDIIHHQTDQVTMMPLFYQGQAAVLGSTRIKGMTSAKVWNAHLWSVD